MGVLRLSSIIFLGFGGFANPQGCKSQGWQKFCVVEVINEASDSQSEALTINYMVML